jgi:20S proteasome alpha/beta subunit
MPTKPKLKKLNNTDNEPFRMTCIIGGKCKDGVVLVADRKIRDKEMGTVTFEEKLISEYYPIVIGASDSNILFKKLFPMIFFTNNE